MILDSFSNYARDKTISLSASGFADKGSVMGCIRKREARRRSHMKCGDYSIKNSADTVLSYDRADHIMIGAVIGLKRIWLTTTSPA